MESMMQSDHGEFDIHSFAMYKPFEGLLELRVQCKLLKEKEEEEVAVRLSMHEISKKFDVFTERIEEVGENATKCSKDITLARTIVLRHILTFFLRFCCVCVKFESLAHILHFFWSRLRLSHCERYIDRIVK